MEHKTIEEQAHEYAEALNDIADALDLPTGSASADIVEAVRFRLNPPRPEPKKFPSGFAEGEKVWLNWTDEEAARNGYEGTADDGSYSGPGIFQCDLDHIECGYVEPHASVYLACDSQCGSFPLTSIRKLEGGE